MRKTVRYLMAAFMFSMLALSTSAQQASQNQKQTEDLIQEAIAAAGNLKEGNLRSEVERDFVLDGGLQTRENTRYMFKKCHLIKITVKFARDESSGTWFDLVPRDRVVSVSKPFLEYPIMD